MFCRWDENGGEKIPEYLRPFYKSVIQTTDEVVSELKLHNNKHAEAVREVVSSGSTSSKEERDLLMSILTSGSRYIQLLTKIHINNQMLHVVKSYHAEVTWRDEDYVPAGVDEHLQISLDSIMAVQTIVLTFISMGDVASRETVDWAFTYPKIIRAASVMARIMNDIMSYEVYTQTQ